MNPKPKSPRFLAWLRKLDKVREEMENLTPEQRRKLELETRRKFWEAKGLGDLNV